MDPVYLFMQLGRRHPMQFVDVQLISRSSSFRLESATATPSTVRFRFRIKSTALNFWNLVKPSWAMSA